MSKKLTKAQQTAHDAERKKELDFLKKFLKPGNTLFAVARRRNNSTAMSFQIFLIVDDDMVPGNKLDFHITYSVSVITGCRMRGDWLILGGGGMSHLQSIIEDALFTPEEKAACEAKYHRSALYIREL